MLVLLGRLFVRLLSKTLQIKIKGSIKKGDIYLFWHGEMLPIICAFIGNRIATLVTDHRDGEFIKRVITPLGALPITCAGWFDHFRIMRELFNIKDLPIFVAADGPKGPYHVIKPGILKFARKYKLKVHFIKVTVKNKLIVPSWDRFVIPIPFTRCKIEIVSN